MPSTHRLRTKRLGPVHHGNQTCVNTLWFVAFAGCDSLQLFSPFLQSSGAESAWTGFLNHNHLNAVFEVELEMENTDWKGLTVNQWLPSTIQLPLLNDPVYCQCNNWDLVNITCCSNTRQKSSKCVIQTKGELFHSVPAGPD